MVFYLKVLGKERGEPESNQVFVGRSDGVYEVDLSPNSPGIIIRYSVLLIPTFKILSSANHRIFPNPMKILKNGKYIAIYAVNGPFWYEVDSKKSLILKPNSLGPITKKDYLLTLPCNDPGGPVRIWFSST